MGRAGEAPAAGVAARRRGPRRRVKSALYQVIRLAINGFLRLAAGLRVRGARNLPRTGPVIVVANHLHNFDPVVVSAVLPRPVFYMAK
ncbi:MAG TPA: 1-acyl-sn-glycerol-3-phosphate acyltransferase, partial [Thermomicrobiales bacterium]|nr:1-acyl-sn-glycerol-3-phosphate acyltransferase [Thermomicrobiales bacterium]